MRVDGNLRSFAYRLAASLAFAALVVGVRIVAPRFSHSSETKSFHAERTMRGMRLKNLQETSRNSQKNLRSAMTRPHKHPYGFGVFFLDAENRVLMKEGARVPLQPKAVDTLLLLVERRDEHRSLMVYA